MIINNLAFQIHRAIAKLNTDPEYARNDRIHINLKAEDAINSLQDNIKNILAPLQVNVNDINRLDQPIIDYINLAISTNIQIRNEAISSVADRVKEALVELEIPPDVIENVVGNMGQVIEIASQASQGDVGQSITGIRNCIIVAAKVASNSFPVGEGIIDNFNNGYNLEIVDGKIDDNLNNLKSFAGKLVELVKNPTTHTFYTIDKPIDENKCFDFYHKSTNVFDIFNKPKSSGIPISSGVNGKGFILSPILNYVLQIRNTNCNSISSAPPMSSGYNNNTALNIVLGNILDLKDNILKNDFPNIKTSFNETYKSINKWYLRYYRMHDMYLKEHKIENLTVTDYIIKVLDNITNKLVINKNDYLSNNLNENILKENYNPAFNIINQTKDYLKDEGNDNVKDLFDKVFENLSDILFLFKKVCDNYCVLQHFNSINPVDKYSLNLNVGNVKSYFPTKNNLITKLDYLYYKEVTSNKKLVQFNNYFKDLIDYSFMSHNDIIDSASRKIVTFKNFNSVNSQQFNIFNFDDNVSIDNYFSLVRYRLLEELSSYFYNLLSEKNNATSISSVISSTIAKVMGSSFNEKLNEIYSSIEDFINELNIPFTNNEDYIKLYIISIIVDIIDHILINRIKNVELQKLITKSLISKQPMSSNAILSSGQPKSSNAILSSDEPLSSIAVPQLDMKEFEANLIDTDLDFELNLGEHDDKILDYIKTKLRKLDKETLMKLSLGEILIKTSNKIKLNESNRDKDNVIQIYYPNDYFSSFNSVKKMILYDQKLIDIIKTQKNVNYNIQDVYRQTCLYYAINSQNYLFIYNLKDKLLFDDISNKEGLTPIKYCIEKIENTLKQFDKSKNLICQFNDLYKINIEEEIEKIDSSESVILNYDKIVLCFLFILNVNYYSILFSDNKSLRNYIQYFDESIDNILLDPITDFLSKSHHTIIKDYIVKNNLISIKDLDKEIQKRKSKITILNAENEYRRINEISGPTFSNIEKNPSNVSIDTKEIKDIEKEIKDLEDAKMSYKSNIQSDDLINTLSINDNNNLIYKIMNLSKVFKVEDLNTYDSFLKIIEHVSEQKINNLFNFHNEINRIIRNKIIKQSDQYKTPKFKSHLDTICNIIKNSEFRFIINKNNKISNKYTKNEFHMICFTIDLSISNSYYRTLKRLIYTYFKTIYPISMSKGKKNVISQYLEFLKIKTYDILEQIKKYVLPYQFYKNDNDNNKEYEPSELTKFLVSLYGKYNLEDDEYYDDDIFSKFDNVKNLIINNDKHPINEDDKIIKYLDRTINPYFQKVYKIAIDNLLYARNGFENHIQSQYINLEILKLLIEEKKSISKLSVPLSSSVPISSIPRSS